MSGEHEARLLFRLPVGELENAMLRRLSVSHCSDSAKLARRFDRRCAISVNSRDLRAPLPRCNACIATMAEIATRKREPGNEGLNCGLTGVEVRHEEPGCHFLERASV